MQPAVGRRAGAGRAADDTRAARAHGPAAARAGGAGFPLERPGVSCSWKSSARRFARRMNLLHQQYDLLVTPQLAITAFAVNHEVPPDNGMKRWWEWSPVHLSVQSHPAARRDRAVRLRAQWAAGGNAAGGSQVRRCAGLARSAGLRADQALRDAGASGGRTLSFVVGLASAAPVEQCGVEPTPRLQALTESLIDIVRSGTGSRGSGRGPYNPNRRML